MNKIKKVNSWNGWDPLKTVMLGNVYNADFFSDMKDKKTSGLLTKLLDETKYDLENFKRELEVEGVNVVQVPEDTALDGNTYTRSTQFEDKSTPIPKPLLSPRDAYITMGNRVLATHHNSKLNDKVELLFENKNDLDRVMDADGNKKREFDAPYVTRIGNRLIVDIEDRVFLPEYLQKLYPHYEHVSHAVGGHNDGCFMPLKPGHVVSTMWIDQVDYERTLPGWNVYWIKDKSHYEEHEKRKDFYKYRNQRKDTDKTWWTADSHHNEEYCNYVDKWLDEWTGWATETIFEVNMLVINPELVFCSNYNEKVFDYLNSIGMKTKIIPWRHRYFWDGGLHCLTVDIEREGEKQNYFGE